MLINPPASQSAANGKRADGNRRPVTSVQKAFWNQIVGQLLLRFQIHTRHPKRTGTHAFENTMEVHKNRRIIWIRASQKITPEQNQILIRRYPVFVREKC